MSSNLPNDQNRSAKTDHADRAYKEALQKGLDYFSKGRFGEAEAFLRNSLIGLGNLYGLALKRQGRLKQATQVLSFIASLGSDKTGHLVNLGNILFETRDYQKAAQAFKKAAEIAPEIAEHWRLLGRCYRQLGDIGMTQNALRKSMELDPLGIEAIGDLAGLWVDTGHVDQAQVLLKTSINRHPDNVALKLTEAIF